MGTMKLTKYTVLMVTVAVLACSGGVFGCESDDTADGDGTSTSDDEGTGTEPDEPPPPSEGFRVFPKYMLQGIPAIVTVEAGAGTQACALDQSAQGGYVCDTGDVAGATATIRVDKDGFDTAVRSPQILPDQIENLDIHLSVEGGPGGTWSECTAAGEFDSCAALCDAQMRTCAVTSCETGQAEWPLATLETYASLDCADVIEGIASSCEELPSAPDVVTLRCCCEG